jgi:DUF2892 family protein
MKKNMGTTDRAFRIVAATAIVVLYLTGTITGIAALALGLAVVLLRGTVTLTAKERCGKCDCPPYRRPVPGLRAIRDFDAERTIRLGPCVAARGRGGMARC